MPLSAIEQRVTTEIASRSAALLDDLRLHVETPTGGGGFESAALQETRERFRTRLAALGATATLVPGDPKPDWLWSGSEAPAPSASAPAAPPTLICSRLTPGNITSRILIAGHLDTVHDPASSFRTLSISPDKKTATGPGCVDMKGGLVIALAALESLETCGIRPAFTFLFNSDEETGSYHSERALRAQAALHDIGLALEPAMANGALATTRGGSGQFILQAFGTAAHVGRDFASGRSAVVALARAIDRAAALSDPARGICVNIGPLRGGTATNVVPDSAAAWGNVRFSGPADAAALASQLDALATADPVALPRIAVQRSFNRPAKPLTPGTERLADLAAAVAGDLGQALPFGSTAGVCDGNILQDAGLPTIDTLGVRGGGLHTPQEWIDLSSLVERCQLLALLIMRLGTPTLRVGS
ncbi:MAG: M20/M25/M40 family metallo-hydrolase [Phycisphaerales bacterium]